MKLPSILLSFALMAGACAHTASTPPLEHFVSKQARPSGSVEILGLEGQRLLVTREILGTLPRERVAMEIHGKTHTFEGVLLGTLLARAGAPTGAALRGAALKTVILVTARDGYQVALSLAEADASMHKSRVILADAMDGAPIDAKDGPFRLLVEGDTAPARSARMVSSILTVKLD